MKSGFSNLKKAAPIDGGEIPRESIKSPPYPQLSSVALPDMWKENTHIIYKFLERRPDYEQLCREVAYVLKQKLKEEGIEYSSISFRAKELNSFLEKLERKYYPDPFNEITDFAGVRVVCLYSSDLLRLEDIINREFEVIEKVDKYKDNSTDRFGYMAIHFLVKLGDEFSGARYDHLKNLTCEIQTRTILQHAWAQIDEHLVYKKKSTVPVDLRSHIIELARVLEEADRRVEEIRSKRSVYIQKLEKTKTRKDFLKQEVNLDSFKAFCERSFPEAVPETDPHIFNRFLKWIDTEKYPSIGHLQEAVEKAAPYLKKVRKEVENMLKKQNRELENWTNLLLFHVSLSISDPDYRESAMVSREFKEILQRIDQQE